MNQGELRQLQSMPLGYAVRKSIRTIQHAYEQFDGNLVLCVSGFDSRIILELCKMAKVDLPSISISAVEPKGNNKLNAKIENIEFLRPTMGKKEVIRKYGYPLVNKQVAMAIQRYTITKFPEQKDYRLNGKIVDGKKHKVGVIPKKYQSLIKAPFWMAEKCCIRQKESPMISWQRKHGDTVPITGERADESNTRLKQYLKHGCIITDQGRKKVMPIGFWSDQLCKEFALKYDMEFSEEYGKIAEGKNGELSFTGEPRTGCDICGFGVGFDTERFARMKKNKPKTWKRMMDGGEFVENDRELWREVEFHNFVKYLTDEHILNNILTDPETGAVFTNLIWVPDAEGYGYREVFKYLNYTINHGVNIE